MRCGHRGDWPEEVVLWICLGGLVVCSRGGGQPPSPRFNTTAWSAHWATGCEARGPGVIRLCAARLAARESSSCPPVRCRNRCLPSGRPGCVRPSSLDPTWTRARSSSKTRLRSHSTSASETTLLSRPRLSGTMTWPVSRPPLRMAEKEMRSIAPGPKSPPPSLLRTTILDRAPGDPDHNRLVPRRGPRPPQVDPPPDRRHGRLPPQAGRRLPDNGRRSRPIQDRGSVSRWRIPLPCQAIWPGREQLAGSATVPSLS